MYIYIYLLLLFDYFVFIVMTKQRIVDKHVSPRIRRHPKRIKPSKHDGGASQRIALDASLKSCVMSRQECSSRAPSA